MINRLLPYDVFISYQRDPGHEFANMIYTYLRAMGYRPYMDMNLRPGTHFPRELESAIDNSIYFLLVLTPNWGERCNNPDDWVRREVFYAVRQKKPIIQFASTDCHEPHPRDLMSELDFLRHRHFEQYSRKHHDASFHALLRGFQTLRFRYRVCLFALMVLCIFGALATSLLSMYASSLILGLAACGVGFLIGLYSHASTEISKSPLAIESRVPLEPELPPPTTVVDFFPKGHDNE